MPEGVHSAIADLETVVATITGITAEEEETGEDEAAGETEAAAEE